MSDTPNLTQVHEQINIARLLITIPFTILLYDYILTFEREVTRYWGTRLTWGSFFFYLNRYYSLFGTIPIIAEYLLTTTDPERIPLCIKLQSYHQYFALLSQVLVAVMLLMRTYALYDRNKTILVFQIIVTLAAFVFALWTLTTGHSNNTLPDYVKKIGCPIASTHAKSLRLAAAWSGMLVFDVMIFSLTVFKALKYTARRGSLLTVLVRDGSVYFGLMILSNACNIGTYTLRRPCTSSVVRTLFNCLQMGGVRPNHDI
ncbi:hypothetical protein B0H10DRAFT_1062 [Mycena sp. CBHHK59/15]|nr:hypothetical protein B0H10DRAFT_1062 [Mycena sp. CBHHK59/15]